MSQMSALCESIEKRIVVAIKQVTEWTRLKTKLQGCVGSL